MWQQQTNVGESHGSDRVRLDAARSNGEAHRLENKAIKCERASQLLHCVINPRVFAPTSEMRVRSRAYGMSCLRAPSWHLTTRYLACANLSQ